MISSRPHQFTPNMTPEMVDNLADAIALVQELVDDFQPITYLPNGLAIVANPTTIARHKKALSAYMLLEHILMKL